MKYKYFLLSLASASAISASAQSAIDAKSLNQQDLKGPVTGLYTKQSGRGKQTFHGRSSDFI